MGLLRRIFPFGEDLAMRDVEPLEGTNMSLWNSIIPNWWAANMDPNQTLFGTPTLADRVWVANRCIQMNAQQIASMPLEFHGSTEPAWVSSPDPNIFPNGIGDAVHAIVAQLYRDGFSCQYVTDFYADGFPRTWTVLPSDRVSVKFGDDGRRSYKLAEKDIDPARVVQIDRNPGCGAHGTPALRAYAQQAYGLLAAGNQALNVQTGGVPLTALKSARKLTEAQAQALQAQWMAATSRRNGAPPVMPPEITWEKLGLSPADLALLETQEWDARTIASAFGVPCVLLNMALQGGLTYQNPGALGEMWWRFELRPTATRVADALSSQMLPRGQWVSFRAEDTFAALTDQSPADDEQGAQPTPVAPASPAQQTPTLTAVGG